MSAKKSGLEIMDYIWEAFFIKKKSKNQIHNESKLSRVTINKYIRLISDNMSKLEIDEQENINSYTFSVEEKEKLLDLPSTYTTRKKRVLCDDVVNQVQKVLAENEDEKYSVLYRAFASNNPDIKMSYSSFMRVVKKQQSSKKPSFIILRKGKSPI